MKKNQIIISITELSCGAFDAQQIHTFEEPHQAKTFIDDKLKEDLELARKSIETLELKAIEGNIRDMWNSAREGSFSYAIGNHEYKISYLKVSGDHSVSDEEIVSALDGFVNSGRSNYDYKKVAEEISMNMHRYCQNELWKFVKQIIRAFASGAYDDRNKTAHNQAQNIEAFMEENNF